MVNNKGGKKYKRGKKFGGEERQLITPDGAEQTYARIVKKLGDCRFSLKCFDGMERVGKVRGKLRKRVWMNEGDYVLVSLRNLENEFSGTVVKSGAFNNKADIFHKYTDDEVRMLKKESDVYKFTEPRDIDEVTGNVIEEGGSDDEEHCSFEFNDI
jgi:translation initiation factor 1A